jgi:hypothetical protein
VSPWRKYNWEYRPSGGLSWALPQSAGSAVAVAPVSRQQAYCSWRPVDRGIAIDLDLVRAGPAGAALYGMNGRLIASVNTAVYPAGRTRMVLRRAVLPPGLYVVKVDIRGSEHIFTVGR